MESSAKYKKILKFVNLCTIQDGLLKSPILYTKTNHGKYARWRIYVGIDGENVSKSNITNATSGPAFYFTKHSIEDGVVQTSARKDITAGRGKGIAQTTPFTQAIMDALSDFNKRVKAGAKLNKDDIIDTSQTITIDKLINIGDNAWRVYPMLLHNFDEHSKHIKYPCLIQPKLDGTLVVAVYHESIGIDMYSRGRENIEDQPHIKDELGELLTGKYPGLYLVGELWKSGYGLQEISGASRRKATTEGGIKLDFNIFDCFYLDKPLGFQDRQNILYKICCDNGNELFSPISKHINMIKSQLCKDKDELDKYYNIYLKAHMEGAVVRNIDAPYEFGITKSIRSYQTLKMKPRHDDEYPVLGFTSGKGNDADAVIWVCIENDNGVKQRTGKILPYTERLEFNVRPTQSIEDRRKIFYNLTANRNKTLDIIKFQPYTVEYSVLSNNYLPQQPTGKGFRLQNINNLLVSDLD